MQLPACVILPFRQNMFSEEYNLTYLLHIEVFLYVFYWQTSQITSFCEFQQTLNSTDGLIEESWSYDFVSMYPTRFSIDFCADQVSDVLARG